MTIAFSYAAPYGATQAPVMAQNIVATSQPLAVQAGLQMLERGGNAMDAALAAATTLIRCERMTAPGSNFGPFSKK
ncbi:hypothetical protein [Pelagibacterium sp.]|uniref:hypothetical protein n=1 Tax=Pelagibacterium sp. TaxID=1967288 RepID=UPI003C7DED54